MSDNSENTRSSVSIDQITTGEYDGEGAFDTLMRTVSTQLERQFQNGRISGTDIASVMAEAIPSVLEQSIVYVLSRCKTDLELKILEQQALEAEWRAKLAKVEHDAGLAQIDKINADIALINQTRMTELANIDPSVIQENSMLGTQRLVQQRQADGFLRDAEQKAVNIMWDLLKVEMSIGEEVDMNQVGAGEANLKKAMLTLMENAGITGLTP